MTGAQLATLALLGAFHGVNPGMGWLFSVSIGMQERSRRALLMALPAIAAGHEASIGVMVVVLTVTSSLVASKLVAVVGGAVLLAFGAYRLVSRRHMRWAGMRLSRWELAGWSFVMSSAHGAGLMLMPVFVFPVDEHLAPLDLHLGLAHVLTTALVALLVHVGAMVAVCGSVALIVYEIVGLGVLRRLWLDLDRVWAVALIGAGTATLLTA